MIEGCCECERINKYMINVFDEMGINYYRNGNSGKDTEKKEETKSTNEEIYI